MLVDRIEAFVRDEASGEFAELVLEAFDFQFERIAPYRAMCERLERTPESVDDWREIPLVPTRAFQTMDLSTGDTGEVFRSSGTTGAARSTHHHPFPDLYRNSIDTAFPAHCLPPPGRDVPMLSLIPDRQQLPDSSLSFMIDHVVRSWGSKASAWAVGASGVGANGAGR